MSDNILQPYFDLLWDLGSRLFYWTFDGWIKEKIDFEPLWNEVKLYNSIGNKPILLKENKTDRTQVYMFTIPVGMSIKDFMDKRLEIAQYLHCDIKNLRIKLINNLAAITVYDTTNLSFHYGDYDFKLGKEIKIPIGISLDDFSTVYWNPTDPNQAHMLIGGSTGSGKSVALNVILEHLCKYDNVELYLQDTKMVDLVKYQSRAKIYNEGTNYSIETLKGLTELMVERYSYLKKYNYKNMEECNRKDKPKYIFYVLEELASFNPKEDKEFYKYLSELLAKGRAAGIFVIITSQACYSEILPGMLKNNINTILGLKTRTGEASKVISGDYDLLTGLRGKGHGYLINANGEQEVQVFNI
jgi:hypothetical protein